MPLLIQSALWITAPFLVNNAPRQGQQGILKHNVLNLAVTIQESIDQNAKFIY